jgi:hypothetical protein
MNLYKPQFSIEIKKRRPVGRVRGAARNRPQLLRKGLLFTVTYILQLQLQLLWRPGARNGTGKWLWLRSTHTVSHTPQLFFDV